MVGLMIAFGSAGVGGGLGLLTGSLMPGTEPATALLGFAAGLAAGILLCITQSPASAARDRPTDDRVDEVFPFS